MVIFLPVEAAALVVGAVVDDVELADFPHPARREATTAMATSSEMFHRHGSLTAGESDMQRDRTLRGLWGRPDADARVRARADWRQRFSRSFSDRGRSHRCHFFAAIAAGDGAYPFAGASVIMVAWLRFSDLEVFGRSIGRPACGGDLPGTSAARRAQGSWLRTRSGFVRTWKRLRKKRYRYYEQAKKTAEGWVTPDHTLWIPPPKGFPRDKQIMVLACGYKNSAASFASATDSEVPRHR